jgi:hypothetical protein
MKYAKPIAPHFYLDINSFMIRAVMQILIRNWAHLFMQVAVKSAGRIQGAEV